MWTYRLLASLLIVSVFGTCRCTAIDTCELTRYEEPGDIQFAVILSIRASEANGSCGEVSYDTLQASMAVQYAVDKLNTPDKKGNKFIPGVKIGFKIFNDCGYDKYALVSATDVLRRELPPEIVQCNQTAPHPIFAGFIGPGRSHSAIAVSDILKGTDIPMVGISTTLSKLSDKTKYPNILRTTISDKEQAKAIVTLVKSLHWTVIAILHTTDIYGQDLAAAVQKLASESQVCVIYFDVVPDLRSLSRAVETLLQKQQTTQSNSLGVVFLGYQEMAKNLIRILESDLANREHIARLQWIFPDSVSTSTQAFGLGGENIFRSVWSVSPMSLKLKEFGEMVQSEINAVSKLLNNKNPWVSTFVDSVCQIHFPGPGCTSFEQNAYVPAIIHAVYALSSAAKKHHARVCSGAYGICPDLREKHSIGLLSEVQKVSFTYSDFMPEHSVSEFSDANVSVLFDSNGDIRQRSGQEVYSINRYVSGKFNKVGAFTNNSSMDLSSTPPEFSRCRNGCQTCIQNPAFVYLPGEILLAGFLSLHWYPEKSMYQFGCGIFRMAVHTIISVEGFLYAVKKMNQETGMKFGAVIFDDCYNSLKVDQIISKYFSGDVPLIDPVTEQVIDLTKVVGVVGSESSSVSIPLAGIFTKLNLPIVSPASTSVDLDDKRSYPYSLRTVVSDRGTIDVIFAVAKLFGWKYISLLYTNNNYGIKAVELFREKAGKENICYAEPIPISVNPDEKPMIEIVKTLEANKAKVVVYIGLEEDIKRFQNTIKYQKLEVVYFGLEDWAVNGKPYPGTAKHTAGSLVAIPMSPRIPWRDFPDYLMNKKPVWSKTSLWFDRFWQNHFQCNLPDRFEHNFGTACNESLRFNLTNAKEWANQFRVSNTINAVASMIKGVVAARKKLCLEGAEFACETFRKNPANVTKFIKEVRLGVGSESFRPYNDDGNGNGDFTIDNLQKLPSGEFAYIQIGRFQVIEKKLIMYENQRVRFYLDGEEDDNIDWSCNNPEICATCNNKSSTGVQIAISQAQGHGDPMQKAILGVLCVILICVLIILLLMVVMKSRRSPKKVVRVVNRLAHNGIANGQIHESDIRPTTQSAFPRIENPRDVYNSSYISYINSSTVASLDFDNEETDNIDRDPTFQTSTGVEEDPYLHPSAIPSVSTNQSSGGHSATHSIGNTVPKTIEPPSLRLIDSQTSPKTVNDEKDTKEKRYTTMPHTPGATQDKGAHENLHGREQSGDNPVMSPADPDIEQTALKTVDDSVSCGLDGPYDTRNAHDQNSTPQQQIQENDIPSRERKRPPPIPVKSSKLRQTIQHMEGESML